MVRGQATGQEGTLGQMVVGGRECSCRFPMRRGDRLKLEESSSGDTFHRKPERETASLLLSSQRYIAQQCTR